MVLRFLVVVLGFFPLVLELLAPTELVLQVKGLGLGLFNRTSLDSSLSGVVSRLSSALHLDSWHLTASSRVVLCVGWGGALIFWQACQPAAPGLFFLQVGRPDHGLFFGQGGSRRFNSGGSSCRRGAGITWVVLRAGRVAGFLPVTNILSLDWVSLLPLSFGPVLCFLHRSLGLGLTKANSKRLAIVLELGIDDCSCQELFRTCRSLPRILSQTWGVILEGKMCAFLQLMTQAPMVWNLTHMGRSCFVIWCRKVG